MKPARSLLIISTFVLSVFFFAGVSLAQTPTPRPTRALNQTTCLARQAAIEKQMSQLVRFSTNMLEVFDNISTRVQNYYTNTVLPSGTTVDNYEQLLATITTRRIDVQNAVSAAQINVDNFTCSGDIKTHFTTYRTRMQSVKQALHQYRLAIKDLIVAVRGNTPTASPTPTPTP